MFRIEFSLSELLRIALGVSTLNRSNLDVLHTVLDYILVKMNCQNERVIVDGAFGSRLAEMLPLCRPPKHQFDQNKVVQPLQKFRKLYQLEKRYKALLKRYNGHFVNGKPQFSNKQWEFYAQPTENILISDCDSDSTERGDKLRAYHLMQSGMAGILLTSGIWCRISSLGEIIDSFRQQIHAFERRNAQNVQDLTLIGLLIHDVKSLKSKLYDDEDLLEDAVDEINKMLIAKLDRTVLPALSIFLRNQFDFVEQVLSRLVANQQRNFPQNKPLCIQGTKNTQCLSCGWDVNPINIPSVVGNLKRGQCHTKLNRRDCSLHPSLV